MSVKGITGSGFAFEVHDHIKENYAFVEAVSLAMSKNPGEQLAGVRKLVDAVFCGDAEQKERFLDFLSRGTGYVPSDLVFRNLRDILDECERQDAEIKN